MDRQTRIEYLVGHYQRPRNKGALEDPEVSMPGGNPGCGDVVTMHVRADGEGKRLAGFAWEGDGCTISMAAASILSEWMRRNDPLLNDILDFDYEAMIDLLGRDIVSTRPRCATLALGTLKAAIKKVLWNRRLLESEAASSEEADTGLVFGEDALSAAASGMGDRLKADRAAI
ncbi:MAG: iron-sulfur cluster assembly scaffold protein [Gemmatimonadota bacterium]